MTSVYKWLPIVPIVQSTALRPKDSHAIRLLTLRNLRPHWHILTHAPIIVMSHFQARPPESTLDVEPLVRFAAVQNALITADLLGDEVQSLDELQAQFLALLVFRHGDILDVSDEAEVVDAVDG